MIKKHFIYLLKLIGILFLMYILKIGLLFSDLHPFKLSDNYYLIGTGGKNYIVTKGVLGKTVVPNLTSQCRWVITPSSIHGSMGGIPSRYFYMSKATSKTHYFVNFSKFRKHLGSKGHTKYTESKLEGLVHLKYGNGRDRKYK